MRDEDEDDPKKPHPVWIGRKGDNASEAEEYGPRGADPDGKDHEARYHHSHVRC